VFGGSSHLEQLKEAGTDMQIISPRPYQMMTSEHPRLVQWYTEETNNIIAQEVKLFPKVFRGVCGLPLTPGVSPKAVLPYLERCVKEQGFVGVLLNPDPGECSGVETPPLGDRFWYPLYEKMCELDIPGHIHSTGCRSERLTYSLHFINEENIAVVSLLNSNVYTDFPRTKCGIFITTRFCIRRMRWLSCSKPSAPTGVCLEPNGRGLGRSRIRRPASGSMRRAISSRDSNF
jgi:predicted TIM-barrel fold metal-dependent hydrolase